LLGVQLAAAFQRCSCVALLVTRALSTKTRRLP
jgi:hypothetical protein